MFTGAFQCIDDNAITTTKHVPDVQGVARHLCAGRDEPVGETAVRGERPVDARHRMAFPAQPNEPSVTADLHARQEPTPRVALHRRLAHLQVRGDLAGGRQFVEKRSTKVIRVAVVRGQVARVRSASSDSLTGAAGHG